MNLAATNIVLLVGIYKRGSKWVRVYDICDIWREIKHKKIVANHGGLN